MQDVEIWVGSQDGSERKSESNKSQNVLFNSNNMRVAIANSESILVDLKSDGRKSDSGASSNK